MKPKGATLHVIKLLAIQGGSNFVKQPEENTKNKAGKCDYSNESSIFLWCCLLCFTKRINF